MKENKLRTLIRENKPSVGMRVWSTNPMITECIGSAQNYDYVEFLAEYSPFDQHDLANIARAAEVHGMSSMIKVDFANRVYVAQKAVAAGFQAILFTDHHTPDEVRETIRMMKPDSKDFGGRFGYPNARYAGFEPRIPANEHIKRLNDVVLAFMIEKKDAVDNIEEICSIPGVDMVQFGPSDYCMNQGWIMNEHMDELLETEAKIFAAAAKYGVHPRVEVLRPRNTAERYLKMGIRDFIFGDEIINLTNFCTAEAKAFREMIAAAL